MGVQEVGDAVKRDGGLAGAWAALDDQESLVGGADDAVLLGLDRGDDVAHAAVTRLAEGVHESALALEFEPGCTRGVQQLVFEAGDASVAGGNVAAAYDAVRLG